MLTTPTLDRLHALGLGGMARAWTEQAETPAYHALPFEDRLGLLLDREAQERDNRRLARHLKAAKLRLPACIEDLDFRAPRGLDRAVMLQLASAQWVAAHQTVLIIGPTGVGKTYTACALTQAAIRAGHTACYLRVPRLLADLALAHGDGRWARLLATWARIDVLCLDDLALQPLTSAQAADLLEVLEDRCQRRSTIVTSQVPVAHWHEALGDPTLADAICDRLTHQAHRLELRGESLRRDRPPAGVDAPAAPVEPVPTPRTRPAEPASARPPGHRAAGRAQEAR